MFKLLRHMKGWAVVCAVLAPLMMLLEVAMDLMLPTLMANIIDIGIANQDMVYIFDVGSKMLLAVLIGIVGGISCNFFAANASMRMGQRLRQALFDKIQSFSFLEIDNFKTSSLITRLTNDVTQYQHMVMMALKVMVRSPLTCIGALVMAIKLSSRLAVVFVIAIPIISVVTALILSRSFPVFILVQQKIDQMNKVMRESILGVRVIKAFSLEPRQEERFDKANKDLMMTSLRAMNINITLTPIVMLTLNLSVMMVLWLGGNMVIAKELEVGRIMAFINYLIQLMHALMMLVMIVINFARAKACADRMNEILDAKVAIENPKEAQIMQGFEVEFKEVSFRYYEHSEYVLKNISFKAKEGETIGIIGATGSGKSSLVGLIPRLYDASSGEVLIGGVNVKTLGLQELRKNIGVVLQDTILFSGTIEENLKFGSQQATKEHMEASAKDAQAEQFIEEKEEGYQSLLEQRGKNLSGGQKQRLSIARTLLRQPKILILDDAASALDMVTETRLQESLKKRMKDKTMFVIAQRISSVVEADKIIVLDEGEIVGLGTHKELLKTNAIYKSIAVSQLGEEVLLSV